MEKYHIEIENKKENVSMIRLMTSFIAMKMDYNVEEIEDLKVSVGEAMNYHIGMTERFIVDFETEDDRIVIRFDLGKEATREKDRRTDPDLSRMILETLMDEVTITDNALILSKTKESSHGRV